jgi:broad specificity phosphatase PhoE
MTLHVVWISHGATIATRRSTFPADEAIEDAARRLAVAMAPQLGGADRAYAAPERRTLETAAALGLAASPDAELRDCSYGRWTGRSLVDLASSEPEALGAWLSDPCAAPHGGESIAEVIQRVENWLDLQARDKGSVVAVAHPAVMRAAFIHAVGAPMAAFWRIDVGPLSRLGMSHDGRRWALRLA